MTVLNDIADLAEALCDPRQHTEQRHAWDANRHKIALTPHRTVVPGLIQQLRDLAEPGVDGEPGGRGGPESCPANIDAVSLLAAITFGSAWRATQLGITVRDSPERNIRGVVGASATIDRDQQHQVRAELRSWASQAEVITGWKTPARELPAPCPRCGTRGALLARVDPATEAWCTACKARWDENDIGLLARHVTDYRDQADSKAREARTRAVEDRRRREGVPR